MVALVALVFEHAPRFHSNSQDEEYNDESKEFEHHDAIGFKIMISVLSHDQLSLRKACLLRYL